MWFWYGQNPYSTSEKGERTCDDRRNSTLESHLRDRGVSVEGPGWLDVVKGSMREVKRHLGKVVGFAKRHTNI